MSETDGFYESLGDERYVIGKLLLRAAIEEDGGLEGLFRLFRGGDWLPHAERYEGLLEAAASPADKERRLAGADESPDTLGRLDIEYMTVAAIEGLPPEDVAPMLLALKIHHTAFSIIQSDRSPEQT